MASVRDNTKWRCLACGGIQDNGEFGVPPRVCLTCGPSVQEQKWDSIAVTIVCDFCAEIGVRWSYITEDFVMDNYGGLGGEYHPGTDWAACDKCKDLIEARDLLNLVARCMVTQAHAMPQIVWTPENIQSMTDLQMKFMHNLKSGPHFEADPENHEPAA